MYNAGVDVHGEDSLGKMALTNGGILERDRFVFATCVAFRVSAAASALVLAYWQGTTSGMLGRDGRVSATRNEF
jgi:hypothetical protein